jgi:hypothetical protein
METIATSTFWFVFWACIGGAVVLVGLLMETMADRKRFKHVNSLRRCQSVKHWGAWILIGGIVIEIVVAGLSAKSAWENDPLNAPINSISAEIKLKVKGVNSRGLLGPGNGIFAQPTEDEKIVYGQSGVIFLEGTNTTKPVYSLTGKFDKSEFLGSGLVGGSNDWAGIVIPCQEIEFDSWDMRDSFAASRFKSGKRVRDFKKVGSLVIWLPRMETNVWIVEGIVEVKVNSLRWSFLIPAQRQGFGFITSQIFTNAENRIESKVLRIPISDFVYPPRFTNRWYDGK